MSEKIPTFKNYEEEAAFWDTHNVTDFLDELEPVKVNVTKSLSSAISVRFPADVLEELRAVADENGVGPTTLIRMWVIERLRRHGRSKALEAMHSPGSSVTLNNATKGPSLERVPGGDYVTFTTSNARSRK